MYISRKNVIILDNNWKISTVIYFHHAEKKKIPHTSFRIIKLQNTHNFLEVNLRAYYHNCRNTSKQRRCFKFFFFSFFSFSNSKSHNTFKAPPILGALYTTLLFSFFTPLLFFFFFSIPHVIQLKIFTNER